MGTNETELTPEQQAEAEARAAALAAPGRPHLILDAEGTPVERVLWNGATQWEAPEGHTVVDEADWEGEKFTGPPETDDQRQRRTAEERLALSVERAKADLDRNATDRAVITQTREDLESATTVAQLAREVGTLARMVDRMARRERRTLRAVARIGDATLSIVDPNDVDEDE